MVLLVPRQIRMNGMTGSVPYYGGRLTPAQAHAAAHPPQRPPAPPRRDPVAALDELLGQGVITRAEYDELRARVGS
ncbi:hypothetical protein GON03_01275 [Nocardioides sp. MAH-18]|uniref:SHOCT domain-containing protein n=1 Tax=Nocardioides agri TaxID=2682843 RepID=A0A6L6XM19_9ACTN|nr:MULTISPECIES: hypothetical protein [unclassified Nocardioides]MBA2956650.1 hypothetical protein [Nocardioides sp. CGMCC 1.13656]MVQ47793.1 hypothetical protein [Nocardioides sp. MAH-18]